MARSSPLGKSSNLVITLGIFLKLLGFFVVLYSYSEIVPSKVQQAEQSLAQRFNVTIRLENFKTGMDDNSLAAVQNDGRAFDAIEQDLKTQIDLFSSQRVAKIREMVLVLPADQVLPLNGKKAKSPSFDAVLADTLRENPPKGFVYQLSVIGRGGTPETMMRAVSDFVQKMVAGNYPQNLLTVGYAPRDGAAEVEFRIVTVRG